MLGRVKCITDKVTRGGGRGGGEEGAGGLLPAPLKGGFEGKQIELQW